MKVKGHELIRRHGVALLMIWTVVILILSLMPGSDVPSLGWMSRFHLDKLAHSIMYGMLVFLAWNAFRQKVQNLNILFIVLGACLIGVLMEYCQEFYVSGRTKDIWDMTFNGIGAAIAGLFVNANSRKYGNHQSSTTLDPDRDL